MQIIILVIRLRIRLILIICFGRFIIKLIGIAPAFALNLKIGVAYRATTIPVLGGRGNDYTLVILLVHSFPFAIQFFIIIIHTPIVLLLLLHNI